MVVDEPVERQPVLRTNAEDLAQRHMGDQRADDGAHGEVGVHRAQVPGCHAARDQALRRSLKASRTTWATSSARVIR